MDFSFTEEQQMLQDSIRRFLEAGYGLEHRAGILAGDVGWSPRTWAALAELGLLALDIDAVRTRRIEENLQRLGLVAETKAADCLDVRSWWDGRPFDAILADVPCSASGVVRRHPDIKVLRRESDIRRLVHTQAAILDTLWAVLKPGGKLLYATCSVFVEENSAQIDAFLVRQPGAQRLVEEQWLPEDKNDGFYYALLRKT